MLDARLHAGRLLHTLKSKLPQGDFGRNVLVLFSGTTLAQLIGLLVSPILTRLYTPEIFGVYALFLAITTILVNVSSAKYEMAIILPERDEDGFSLLVLSCIFVLILTLLAVGCVVGLNTQITRWLGNAAIGPWLYAVPVMVFLNGTYTALNYWNNRRQNFKRLATNRVLRSSLTAGTNVGLGLAGISGGLITGAIAGQAITTGLFVWQISKEERQLASLTTWRAIKQQAARYKNFPRFLIASGFVESAAGQFPSILISSLFGIATLGFFSQAMRMIGLPMNLMAESIRDVFKQAASKDYNQYGNCVAVFRKTFKRLLLLAVIPCAVILTFGPFLFGFVFGEQWRVAGEYAQIMTIMFFLRFVSSPLSSTFYIAEKQKWDLIIQTTLFITIIGSLLGVAALHLGSKAAVAMYASVYSVKYLLELYLSYRFSQGPARVANLPA